LIFTTFDLANKLTYCEIDNKIKNFSNYLLVKTILNFDAQQELSRRFQKEWKSINTKNFYNMLSKHLLASLLDESIKRWRIDEFTTKLFNVLEKTTKKSTSWAKSYEIIKYKWSKNCTQAIKKAKRLRQQCRTLIDWTKYVKTCDKKGKILRKHKRVEFRLAMQELKDSNKKLFKNAK